MLTAQKSESARVAFLIDAKAPHNDNHTRLPALFEQNHWDVHTFHHSELGWHDERLWLAELPIDQFDLIWPVGFGPKALTLDFLELLGQAPAERLLTHSTAYLTLHGKSAWVDQTPQTCVSTSLEQMSQHMQQHPEVGQWVLKPNAGSLGRDVHLIEDAASLRAIIDANTTQYWLLQPFNEQILDGEFRTLVFGDTVIATYKRMPTHKRKPNRASGQVPLANLSQEGEAVLDNLPESHLQVVHSVSQRLAENRVGFAAIDTVGGELMEVNLANPGGLGTLHGLCEPKDYTSICARLMSAINARYHPRFAE